MRTALVSLLLASSVISFAAPPCTPKVDHRKIDQIKIQNIQKDKVNSAKELWRLDAKVVAQQEVVSGLVEVQYRTFTTVPVKLIKGDDRVQVFSYEEHGKIFEITMKKPEWLLPYSGIYKMMMWVVTDVKTICPAK